MLSRAWSSYHEIALYFLITLPPGSAPLEAEAFDAVDAGTPLRFRWFARAKASISSVPDTSGTPKPINATGLLRTLATDPSYSQRSATIGSIAVARRTGTYDATSATASIAITASTSGTVLSTGNVTGASACAVVTAARTCAA